MEPILSDSINPDNTGPDLQNDVDEQAEDQPVRVFNSQQSVCLRCGGQIDVDGYCSTCGAKAPSPYDHVEEQPQSWVMTVTDRGIRHTSNEDGVHAIASEEPGKCAALVVCDGVSSASDSDVAARAAALAGANALIELARNIPMDEENAQQLQDTFIASCQAAADAVLDNTDPEDFNPPSCTIALAAIQGGAVVAGSVGDSRVYWVPETGEPELLSIDDSIAQEHIAAGVEREIAEAGPDAHVITRWLGRDAPEILPDVHLMPAQPVAGWLVVCSDGLWNYASDKQSFATMVRQIMADSDGLANGTRKLIEWANHQGGVDNITAAVARLEAASDPLDVPTTKLNRAVEQS